MAGKEDQQDNGHEMFTAIHEGLQTSLNEELRRRKEKHLLQQ